MQMEWMKDVGKSVVVDAFEKIGHQHDSEILDLQHIPSFACAFEVEEEDVQMADANVLKEY